MGIDDMGPCMGYDTIHALKAGPRERLDHHV